jgi:hypothetical protein
VQEPEKPAETERTCRRCSKIQPIERFKIRGDAGGKIRRHTCEACLTERRHELHPPKPKRALQTAEDKRRKRHERYIANKEHYNAQTKAYYREHREEQLAIERERRASNPTLFRERERLWRIKNGDRLRAAGREKYQADPMANREAQRRCDAKNRAKRTATGRAWRERNIVKVRENEATYQRNRRASDFQYRMRCILRNRATGALRAHGARKSARTAELVGCTCEQFLAHIESQFYDGMTWETFGRGEGRWQVDHIAALALFDLSDADQQRRAFHYTNQQPLWHRDHLKKTAQDVALISKMRLKNAA